MFTMTWAAILQYEDILTNDYYYLSVASFFPFPSFAISMIRFAMCLSSNFVNTGIQLISPKNLVINASYDFCLQFFVWGILLYMKTNRITEKLLNKCTRRRFKNNRSVVSSNNTFYQNNALHPSNDSYIPVALPSRSNEAYNCNEYVQEQRNKILDGSYYSVKLENLTKIYKGLCSKPTTAVNDLSLCLDPCEKFGLMGFNGSGKTTTFKSITDEISFEHGNIKLFGKNTLNSFNEIRKDMGYCPQSNALFDFLTVEETIKFYYFLKKQNFLLDIEDETKNHMKKEKQSGKIEQISRILKKFNLEKFKNTLTTNLSGGNKRKLNFAIALMSNPKLILLDEPSTGVDPESRRSMWKNINDIPKFTKQFNMILSTHSMEEAEILCDSIGWMKNGNFVCIGNPEKLKLKFSQGYYLHMKFRKGEAELLDPNHEKHFDNKNQNIITNIDKINFGAINKHGFDTIDSNDKNNKENVFYSRKLKSVLEKLSPHCEKITIGESDEDNPGLCELVLNVKEDKQADLFSLLLSLKSIDHDIQEININMQSLENILTNI